MRLHTSWLRAGSSLRANSVRPKASMCIFCQHRPSTSRLAMSTESKGSPRNNQLASAQDPKRHHRRFSNLAKSQQKVVPKDDIESGLEPPQLEEATEEMQETIEQQEAREIERERWRQRRAEEKAAMREWQAAIDAAPERVTHPRPETWDGMEMIGGETEFDTGLKYKGYLHETKLQTKPEVTAALYRAVVEVFTTMAHDRDPTLAVTNASPPSSEIYQHLKDVHITIATADDPSAEAGALKLEYPDEATESLILASLEPTVEAPDPETDNLSSTLESPLAIFESEEALQAQISAWGTDWHQISLANPAIKFAIIKRATKLLGTPIPDTTITTSQTTSALLTKLSCKPPPRKLHEVLTSPEAGLASLPNVTVHARRQTPVDKETAVGRWKVYRAAVRARGLPVLKGVSGWEFESAETRLREMEAAEEDREMQSALRERIAMGNG